METENSEPSRSADARLDEPWDPPENQLLNGKSIASAAAVVLALAAAVVWASMSEDPPAVDADSAAHADFDSDSASGSSPSTEPTESTDPARESESATEGESSGETSSEESASEAAEPDSALPGTGVYRARQEASGLCMTWGEEPDGDRSVMVLGECGDTDPELTWVEDGDRYEVEMAFDEWTPCMTVDDGGTEDGMLVGFDGCDGLDAQTWELAPVGDAYQLLTAASGDLCLSVLKSSSAESGDAVAVQDCDSGDEKQLWTLL
ncbi:RICIN domain-containing protein [Glycomyces harbinensis]|uniref:Ricin-type beta-trefoil lectin domain-containing protein n=1 Tax=Glycomyces harbinensis TaxID=58114 RepID=A0A1G6UBI9_9ACTN|nr:ricin-type beta-trefoil lectin domain protein [Glycomyces harbinensis]SDD38673.1 Ricin-type beta-trefoil lectin domain-containing protein [Glycomyces harbinensis]